MRVKTFLPSNIDELLTPLALAYFIAGDGSYQKDKGVTWLCTDSFTPDEVDIIRSALLSKFDIHSTRVSNGKGQEQ